MKNLILLIAFLFYAGLISAQSNQDPEFTKGFILLGKLNNGFTSGFKSYTPDLYLGGLGLNPQITVAENVLRIGVNAGMTYNNKKLSGLFGPMLALKIKTLDTKYMGSYANIHLLAEANWGTSKQQMAGGGLAVELFKKIHLGITAQRDYYFNTWWFQSFIGVSLSKSKDSDD